MAQHRFDFHPVHQENIIHIGINMLKERLQKDKKAERHRLMLFFSFPVLALETCFFQKIAHDIAAPFISLPFCP